MKRRPSISRRLEQVLQDLEDGTLSAEDHWWLMSQLRESPEVRRAYREHMTFAAALHGMADAWGPEHGHENPGFPVPPPRWQRLPKKSFYAAAALIALLAMAASFFALHSWHQPPASITAGADAMWSFGSGGIGPDGEFLPGTRLSVSRGSLEVVTRTRTRMFVEGPAQLEIIDPELVSLSSGKAWFDAGSNQKFSVLTERLRASGSGSRFGVAVSTAGDRVQVETGKLRVEPKLPGIPITTLGPGQAATSDLVGRSTPSAVDPGLFVADLVKETSFIHWSFDEENAGAFPAMAHGLVPSPIRVTGVNRRTVAPKVTNGAFGSGLDLTNGDSFAESDFPGISGSGPRSVAIWIKGQPFPRRAAANLVEYTPSIVMWGDESIRGGSWTLRAHCITGIIGTQWSGNGFMTAGKIGTQNVLDDRWHHIACVFTGEVTEKGEVEIHQYIDGQRVPTTWAAMGVGVDTRVGSDPATRLRVACDSMMPGGPGNVPVMVDELFIVRGALTDAQIKTLYSENRLTPRQ